MKVLLIQAGGTIDKDYPAGDDHHGYGFEIQKPAFNRIIERANPSFEFETKEVVKKDSLDLKDEDRKSILEACLSASAKKIVITHGTDTMVETAKVISELTGKTIVITGAMSPERFKDSDADFNVGFAIAALNAVEEGVYIAMNGSIFEWDKVIFDKKLNRFIAATA